MNAIDNKNKSKKVNEWKDSIDNIIGEFDKLWDNYQTPDKINSN